MKDLIDTLDDPNSQLKWIQAATDLRSVNSLLTDLMGKQKVQALIKDESLKVVRDAVMDLAIIGEGDDAENRLIGAAVLGRLAAVARARESIVYQRLPELFEEKPLALESLAEADEKYYAALCLQNVEAPWLAEYCSFQAVEVDTTAERARKVLLEIAIAKNGDLSAFWQQLTTHLGPLKAIENDEPRYNRVRRITADTLSVVREWNGEVGADVGLALADWVAPLIRSSKKGVDDDVLVDIVDNVFGMLIRIVELRFSNALLAPTYAVINRMKKIIDKELWREIVGKSQGAQKVKICLEEAALVLARQNRTDSELIKALKLVFSNDSQMKSSLKKHFESAPELDPQIRLWWEQGGEVKKSQREVEQNFGNSEDQQIGSLLVNVEESKSVMAKLERAVVPSLEIYDPPLAATVKRAAANFNEIAIATKQLAQMRKLKRMDLKGQQVGYDPVRQDMLGGHKLGVREVRVERDGVKKVFAGTEKVLVKPRVTPLDEDESQVD